MKVRWSPEAALRVARTVCQAIAALTRNPRRGRDGRVEGTRELVLAPLPYIVVYRLLKNAVEVARVLHGAQRWP